MATKKELFQKAKALNIVVNGNESAKELEALIKGAGAGSQNNSATPSKDAVYVWVKDRAYISDTQRVESGLYLLDEVPARFSKMGNSVEVLGAEVSPRKLGEIAKWAGVKDARDVSDEELLAKLTSVFTPF